MKKICLFILMGLLFCLTGCNNTKAITKEEFIAFMEENNFIIHNITAQFTDPVKNAIIATNDNYTIEYYELNSQTNAIENYNTNVEYFKENKEGNALANETLDEDGSKYTESSTTKYNIISRIKSTYIYCSTDISNKDKVNNYLEKLGY